ncbi:reverse transcriptase domain-containing protein [Pontibacter silvestris]|uniref:RNA-directed DNA polymerase n=1 Tax=Pontibacter silvestris TaxID=2305183 RepID=A0ABW4WVY4_9BACT|nr:reverse transcriptase domain-containing protein [Pontibacter silvestris]MCC9136997.1 reverse transcriptase family protein [Pontibacter silvestris]
MNWVKYQTNFINRASDRGLDEGTINFLLAYAKALYDNELPIIFDKYHLANLVGYKVSYLERATKNTSRFYKTYEVPKKQGGKRIISEPLPSLKHIQKWILVEILNKLKPSKYAKAFIKRRNTKSNAVFHRNKNIVLTIDIKDFFGSIKAPAIIDLFKKLGYTNHLSCLLGDLCTLNGKLPQGASTSPALSNLIFFEVDNKISDYCSSNNIFYSRYADDLTFSGDFNVGKMITFVRECFNEANFTINEEKLRTRRPHQRQEVTGIVVNQKLQAPKDYRRHFRQEVYYIKKYGLQGHLEFIKEKRNNYLLHLIGKGNYIYFLNKNDIYVKESLIFLKELYFKMMR